MCPAGFAHSVSLRVSLHARALELLQDYAHHNQTFARAKLDNKQEKMTVRLFSCKYWLFWLVPNAEFTLGTAGLSLQDDFNVRICVSSDCQIYKK